MASKKLVFAVIFLFVVVVLLLFSSLFVALEAEQLGSLATGKPKR